MPPVCGSADDTSARVSAPHRASTPPTIQTAIKADGEGRRFAIAAGDRNIPEPIVVPTTTMRASKRPMRRGRDSGKETDLAARVPKQYELLRSEPFCSDPGDQSTEGFRCVGVVHEQRLGSRGQLLRLARGIRGDAVSVADVFVGDHESGRAQVLAEQLADAGNDVAHASREGRTGIVGADADDLGREPVERAAGDESSLR